MARSSASRVQRRRTCAASRGFRPYRRGSSARTSSAGMRPPGARPPGGRRGGDKGNLSVCRNHQATHTHASCLEAGTDAGLLKPTTRGFVGDRAERLGKCGDRNRVAPALSPTPRPLAPSPGCLGPASPLLLRDVANPDFRRGPKRSVGAANAAALLLQPPRRSHLQRPARTRRDDDDDDDGAAGGRRGGGGGHGVN